MHILLFGASGHVGTGIAQHLGPDHSITGVVRRPPDADAPYQPLVVPAWVDEPDEVITALAASEAGPVDAVIAAVGGWYIDAPVLERGLAKFDTDYDAYLRGHFTACAITQQLSTKNDRRPVHLALNGVASVEALSGSGAISVFGAAQKMLIEVAAAETPTVDYRELRVMAPIGGDDRNDLSGGVETVGLAEVAASASAILTSPDRFDVSTEIHAGGTAAD
ncbi:NAD(P)-dependent oxidoreductase [Brevibacterium spongiae]|uniref:NAD(P)-dependent oxidoreductase n=1 Tax=Brevibacterium spongiae TaxID=2909672 RepID=A0ABY5SJY5_9MICO|nr:NAD(P)-dependent oxidoreductase [Brevibacterium spongiae]UVI34585.1 NAD(P)-dependent oxidoreductase [Brevibacterium spongiae]